MEFKASDEAAMALEQDMMDVRGKAEVIVAKQRHGPTGMVPLGFQPEFTRFFDLAEDDRLPDRFE